MMAADSTVRNTVARLRASFQINDLVPSRLQCSVARIWAAYDPSDWSLATPAATGAAASGASGAPDSDRALLVSWSVVPIADLLERQDMALAVETSDYGLVVTLTHWRRIFPRPLPFGEDQAKGPDMP
jgi:hypothetical protein